MRSFLKFSLVWFLFGFCLSIWRLFWLFLAIQRPSVKPTHLCAFLTGVTATETVPCAAGRWLGQETPGWCQRPLQKMTLPPTSWTWWMRRGSPTDPDPAHQDDHGRTTWSFCFPERLVLPLLAVLPQPVLSFSSWLLWVCAALLKHRVSEQVSLCAVFTIKLFSGKLSDH